MPKLGNTPVSPADILAAKRGFHRMNRARWSLGALLASAGVVCGAGCNALLGVTDLSVAPAKEDAEVGDAPNPGDAKADALADASDARGGDGGVATTGICSPDGWCWLNPLPTGNAFNGVWGSRDDDVWAVGNGPTLLHYDGAAWSSVMLDTTLNLSAVWGTSATDVWVIAEWGDAWHLDGTKAWKKSSLNGAIGRAFGLHGTAPNDVWIVGDGGRTAHFDGSTWSSVSNPVSGTSTDLRGVWAAASNDVWAVGGQGIILHWNGSMWTSQAAADGGTVSDDLICVSGTGPDDVWIGGSNGRILHKGPAGIQNVDAPLLGSNPILSISAHTQKDVWFGSAPAVFHFDGTSFALVPIGTRGVTRTPWTSPSGVVYFPADNGLFRYAASQATNLVQGLQESLIAVSGSGPGDVWACGGDQSGTCLRWDGANLTEVSAGPEAIEGIWLSGPGDVWTTSGTSVQHRNGSAWDRTATGAAGKLHSIWGRSTTDLWAVGESGTIVHFDGSSWTSIGSGVTAHLYRVRGVGSETWIVGAGGTVLRSADGKTFSPVAGGNSNNMFGLYGASPSAVWTGGYWGLQEWNGSTWVVPSSSPLGVDFFGLGANEIYGTGGNGSIAAYLGASWAQFISGTNDGLAAVWASSSKDIWVVGYGGVILHRAK